MKPPCRQIVVAPNIRFTLVVLSTIGIDDQTMLITHKIDYPGSNRHLSTKLGSGDSTVPQQPPQRLLSARRALAQGLRESAFLI